MTRLALQKKGLKGMHSQKGNITTIMKTCESINLSRLDTQQRSEIQYTIRYQFSKSSNHKNEQEEEKKKEYLKELEQNQHNVRIWFQLSAM